MSRHDNLTNNEARATGHLSEPAYVEKHARKPEQIHSDAHERGHEISYDQAEGLAAIERDRAVRRYCDERAPISAPASKAYKDGWERIWGKGDAS